MDQQHHSTPDDAGATPRPGLTEGEAEEVVDEPLTADPTPGIDPEPGVPADAIMSNLPRSRPQRVTERRRREQSRDAQKPRRPRAARSQKTQPAADRRTGARPAAAKKSAAPARSTAARRTASRQRRSTAATGRVTAQARTPSRTPSAGSAPSLPRLAVDGAVEAAKLPLRISGRLTLRALDAVARGLRGH